MIGIVMMLVGGLGLFCLFIGWVAFTQGPIIAIGLTFIAMLIVGWIAAMLDI